MINNKKEIIKNICYTELVYGRINKKLSMNFTINQIEAFIIRVLSDTPEEFYSRIGKNYYITNKDINIRVTVNSNTFRVITVDRLKKLQSLTE
ncbi:MAG: DUF3781 domain-containing protein [Spirochaetales bacterium]|nr:DUF3781 domain-containing protein [Spirochaetales bacterium]